MSDFLSSLKADLASRKMVPLVALAAVALVGALAYVALASKGSGSETPALNTHAKVESLPGPDVASAPANPNAAVSETTFGTKYQHGGKTRNPFAPVEGAKSSGAGGAKSSATSESSSSGTSSGGKGSPGTGSGNGSSGESKSSGAGSPSGESKQSGGSPSGGPPSGGDKGSEGGGEGSAPKPPVPVTLYTATVTLQRVSESGEAVGRPQVFKDVEPLQPLPSKQNALLLVAGAIHDGKQFVFVLVKEAILRGPASCIPGPAHCESIAVPAGKSEELQYLLPSGAVESYNLTVTKIEKRATSAAKAARRISLAGRKLLAHRQLSLPAGVDLPRLR